MEVLFCGAGIAGTALAYWLRRYGMKVTVVERAAAVRDGGYKVDIRGAALVVVRRMGILDQIRELRTDVRGGSVVNAAGRRVASMDGDTFGGRVHGDAELLRGDLNRLLFERTSDDGVEYRFDGSVVALEGMAGAPDFYFDTLSQVHLDRWSSGRVALVGDAAYCGSPASGQGTSLALVGAYVLAGELATASGDHRAAFTAYEQQLRPFVARNQALGPANVKRMVMRTRDRFGCPWQCSPS